MSEAPVIELKDVSFTYDGTPVLTNANISVSDGDLACIVGPNGGGKTTMLKLILGLIKPATGEVRVYGQAPEHQRRRIGYMAQHIHFDPNFPVSALDVVLMGRLDGSSIGRYSRRDKQKALEALEQAGIADLLRRSFASLSGGQRQRVLLCRALVSDPEILLLDEPMASLDVEMEEKLRDFLEELNKRMTILMVTHDIGFVFDIIKSVICVKRNVAVHPTSEITSEIIQDMYDSDMRIVRHDMCK